MRFFLVDTCMKKQPSLVFCILMDLIGMASFSIPLIGEFADVIWAPLSAIIYTRAFGGGWKGTFGGVFSFVEELLPGTDIIPTFTLTWLYNNYVKKPGRTFSVAGRTL